MAKNIKIRVGILTASEIIPEFHGGYMRIGNLYQPVTPDSYFTLENVMIGKGFHWQRSEKQSFRGALELIKNGNLTTAVNILPLEEYLESVISSEMAPTTHPQLLMAHAIISRTWALSRIRNRECDAHCTDITPKSDASDDKNIIRWYDAEGHIDFDVCADDHCQRYQGIQRISPEVKRAVKLTRGKVLLYKDKLCDARYSKCCGGAFEEFNACWEDIDYPYLKAGRDIMPEQSLPDLTGENNAQQWIMSRPDSFCANYSRNSLKQNLNAFDLEHFSTPENDFYRWKINYGPGELEQIIKSKSGIDFGTLIDIIPLKRGKSGRIIYLEIIGSIDRVKIGKELEIRKWLSESHLPSSAFVAVHETDGGWTFYGAGWGHGVGLCQIGAAEMACRGYNYHQILSHYYPGAIIDVI